MFADTGLQAGAKLPGLLGYEVDCAHSLAPVGARIRAASPWVALNDAEKHGIAHMSIYDAASGAVVFATGSIQWAWGLDDYNVPTLRQSRLSLAAQHITRNVLQRFLSAANNDNPSRLDATAPS